MNPCRNKVMHPFCGQMKRDKMNEENEKSRFKGRLRCSVKSILHAELRLFHASPIIGGNRTTIGFSQNQQH